MNRKTMWTSLLIITSLAAIGTLRAPAGVQSAQPCSMPKDQAFDNESEVIKDLDSRYQRAVQENDAATMDQLLADDFMLVTGSGKACSKADLLAEARSGRIHYDRQDDQDQIVRFWGNTAVITAKLTAKGSDSGKPFEYRVWFSDTYVKTATGWRYVFGQSSLPAK